MQCLCGTHLRALIAEDALCSVFPLAGFPVDLHIHGAGSQTFPAMDAFALIAVDAEQRKVAHGLEKNRNGTKILAERAVILKGERQSNARKVIERVSGEEQPEHDALEVRELHQEQGGDESEREREHHIAQRAQLFFAGLLRHFEREQV